ncbi:MAG: queuosine precursor transporter [Holosporaceae bacterium]|jgi:uncharacterized integral membrane protein (TIGR00697 family)|nr:queuosine precursor transporter [Holosporaceae bacterium]
MSNLLSLLTLVVCFTSILILMRYFGKSGLFIYSTVALIAANIQILKLTKYSGIENPVALGTVVFSTIFAVDNILTEYFGAQDAKKCVWISFTGYLFFTLIMKMTVLHPSVEYSECINLHREIGDIFSPTLTLFISSIASYVTSQQIDIHIFSSLKKLTKGKYLWGRSLISMVISTFFDNFVFSLLAWVVFAHHQLGWSSLWDTYIFITYFIRLIIAALCVPLVRLAKVFLVNGNVQKF